MKQKKKLLLNSRLYLILNKERNEKDNFDKILAQIDKSAVDIIQLREIDTRDRIFLKDAQEVKRICQKKRIAFIVNNRLDVAYLADSDGIHLGQSDLPIKQVRQVLGKNKIIGITCRNLKQAKKAKEEGADYISIGPIFKSRTKSDLVPLGLKMIKPVKKLGIPFFVIGGINSSNAGLVLKKGAKRLALCSAICRAKISRRHRLN